MVVPRSKGHPSLVFLPLALPFVILAAVGVYGTLAPSTSSGPPAPGRHGSLVWGNGIFANRAELKAWMTLHGGNYESWAKSHPAALGLVSPKRPAHRTAAGRSHVAPPRNHAGTQLKSAAQLKRAAQLKAAKPKPVTATPSEGGSSGSPSIRSGPTDAHMITWLLIALGLLLGAAAAAPRGLFKRLGVAGFREEQELRISSAAAGLALLAGVVVATQLI
jgi:hypothetical protein